ncbi:DUF2577 domain-containing protein [Tissierella sp. MSJ-40]|uniref:DUF2577 domain-containing protein n=1 Tax=Tissierella simiarum TaxID=2841534 RepID=A0ABS6EBI6_9FIRM|nr:DUF2577 family protein [Tissierella simiarum]MBU5440285.1 DUF2577 domain-containing protein [Tissierella simiarum]
MIKQIQTIIHNYLEAKKLTDSVIGTIEEVSPKLKVNIDNKFVIDEDFIHVLSNLELTNDDVGKRLLLLRVQDGQFFIVLDRY